MLNKIDNYKFVLCSDSDIHRWNRDYLIGLQLDGERESNLYLLFGNLSIEDVPEFLDAVINSNEWGYRFGGFYKGPIFEERESPDEEDLDIKADEVWTTDGGSNPIQLHEKIKLDVFFRITIDYAHKCLEAVTWYGLKEKGIVTDEWIETVKNWILKVENDPTLTQQKDKATSFL